jgi:hypothetical protein
MDDKEKLDRSGAYDYERLLDQKEPPPEEAQNPSGIGRGDCDDSEAAKSDSSCDVELTAQVEDLFLEETKPGHGIPGFEGEEDGGG